MQSAPDSADLEALVRAAQAGDTDALAQLLQSGLYIIHATVEGRVPEDDVEDVLQEVRLAVWEALPSLTEPGAFRVWLRTIANRKIADHYRAHDEAEPGVLIQGDDQGLQGALERIEDWTVAEELLADLSPRYQVVLLLRGVDELPFAEVGRQMDITEVAARTLFQRAKIRVFSGATRLGAKTTT